jgi:mevalonate kinase
MDTFTTYDAPGKVFLLGEYAVLADLPAWLVAVGPRFRLGLDRASKERVSPEQVSKARANRFPFAPNCPAGRLFSDVVRQSAHCADYSWSWQDPYKGEGGFGGSSAQFILLYRSLAPELGWVPSQKHVLEIYRSLHSEDPVPPSGADIATQWEGGAVRFDRATGARRVPLPLDLDRVLLFSATGIAGRKIKTHEHLHALGRSFFDVYKEPFKAMERVIREFDDKLCSTGGMEMDDLGESLNAYANELEKAGLESPDATRDRMALRALAGVCAVKGTGAGLSDAVWVILNSSMDDGKRRGIIRVAESRGLKSLELSVAQMGISEGN